MVPVVVLIVLVKLYYEYNKAHSRPPEIAKMPLELEDFKVESLFNLWRQTANCVIVLKTVLAKLLNCDLGYCLLFGRPVVCGRHSGRVQRNLRIDTESPKQHCRYTVPTVYSYCNSTRMPHI